MTKTRGVTLIEAMVALTLFTVVVGSAAGLFLRSRQTSEMLDAYAAVEGVARERAARMAQEIRQSGSSSPDWFLSAAGNSLTFNKCLGTDGDDVLWSPAITYDLVLTPGEGGSAGAADAIDNDRNGLTDESYLRRQEQSNPVPPAYLNYDAEPALQVLGGMIQPGGLTFSLSGRTLTISVTVSSVHSETRNVVTATQTAEVTLRN